jgi:hypothetical protein
LATRMSALLSAALVALTLTASAAPAAKVLPSGKVLLTTGMANGICDQITGRTDPEAGTVSAKGSLLLGRNRAGVYCENRSGGGDQLVVFDAAKDRVLQRIKLTGVDSEVIGSRLLTITQHNIPPHGLQSGSRSFTLSLRDINTGKSWTAPLPADGEGDDTNARFVVGPSGIPGHPTEVFVSFLGSSSFDARTGSLLWHTSNTFLTGASGWYVGDGIAEVDGYQDNDYGNHSTGLSATTGAVVWDLRHAVACGGESASDTFLVGDVEWNFDSDCVEAHNIATGQQIIDQAYPEGWDVLGTPEGILTYGNGNLSFYRLADPTGTPVWREPAGESEPLVIAASRSLVAAPSGRVIVNNQTGAVIKQFRGVFDFGPFTETLNGLVASQDENGNFNVMYLG